VYVSTSKPWPLVVQLSGMFPETLTSLVSYKSAFQVLLAAHVHDARL
jgi:hypothetical protein